MKRRGYSTDRKPASIHGAVLAHEFGRSGVILRGGARFFGDPFDFARQHRLAAAVAGGARRRSMADTLRGTLAAEVAKRRCGITCRRVF
jgi:hypothetical protein